jgi:hypothetical protein
VHNAYSLYASQATYQGWRATTNNKRVVILTRSGYWVRIVESGATFTAFISPDGNSWTQDGSSVTLILPTTFYVGLVLTSHSDGQLATAHFDNVTFIVP